MNGKFRRIQGLAEYCPECKRANALAVWGATNDTTVLACDFCRYEETEEDDDRYMGSDSDFSDHASGIDY